MIAGLIIGGVVLILIIWLISINNRLVSLKNNRESAFADIDVQLKQRYDLIPQLLGAVKGYMNHESEVLTRVTEARAGYLRAGTIAEKIEAENKMTSAMNGFNIQLEAYPDLKANTNFMHLQQEIGDMENKLAAVRRFFNSSTKEYNNGIEQFPSNIIAKSKGYKTEPMFDLGVDQRQTLDKAPEVKF
ncbi:LemA family protein [uncultured Fluviicola sp.]|jgi:LemA protein|uniref:LemA family protein n=1 Tax=uncultured Fluviicola sp. TaxID=463303 RepID=UPI0025E4CAC8|nr:LemA family protein [uncultured Fluviicola sp.]